MRVTFVALNYAPSRGGAQEHVRRVAEGLVARGHEVTVLTTDCLRSPSSADPGRIDAAREVLGGVDVQRFAIPELVTSLQRAVRRVRAASVRRWGRPVQQPGPVLSGPWSPGLVRAVRRAVRTQDVVVGCSAPFATLILPAWCRRGGRARIASMPLLHLTSAGPHPTVVRALRRSDLVLASTEFEAAADREAGVDPAKVAVIPPGVASDEYPILDPAAARARCGLPERTTVGFIGRLAAYKGVDTLVAAAPRIWKVAPETTVLVAGSAAGWAGRDQADAADPGRDRLVVREGFADAERGLLLAACDVVVHPSSDESFGLIALEAWAAGRPVVLGDIPCVRSFVRPGETAELVGPTDDRALAGIVTALLGDPERRRRLAAAGRAELAAGFEWERVCDAWDAALGRVGRAA